MLSKATAFLSAPWHVMKSGLITLIWKNRPRIRGRKQSPQPARPSERSFGMLEEASFLPQDNITNVPSLSSYVPEGRDKHPGQKDIILQHSNAWLHTALLSVGRFQKN
jgi:hypothetical protein